MMASKVSSTPCAQDGQLVPGAWLSSTSVIYRVQSILGEGTFGKVAKCTRMNDLKTVAIKMIKNKGCHVEQANAEVAVLQKLKMLNADKCNLVQWYEVFTDRGHICLEFEHLDKSLYDFMKERYFRPLLLNEIRPVVQQLANALNHLKAAGIIHADLKLENVMLVNHRHEPYRVKVIDFGLACNVSAARLCSYIQSRPYRAPEIILGLPFTEAIDMWSLGCMAATMYLGTLLYPGRSQYDMMRYIVETQGQPPDHLLNFGHYTTRFFQRDNSSTTTLWKLKTPQQFHKETGIQPMETRRLKLTSLDHMLHIRVINTKNSADKAAEMSDVLMFVDMLKGMLQLDAASRITPRQVLEHQFISMRHILSMYPLSYHVKSCFKRMEVCQNNTLTSNNGKAVCGSLQHPPSSIANLTQQNHSPHTEGSSMVQPHCINPHPSTSTQTKHLDKPGMKRKVDHEDRDINKTSHPSKRGKSTLDDHLYRRHAAPTNYSRSSQDCAKASTALRSNPATTVHSTVNANPTKSSQTQSFVRSSFKRKTADGEDTEHQKCKTYHNKRSDNDRKKFRKSSAHPSTSSCSSQTQICVSPRVKRKMAHSEDSDQYKRSDHEKKRARKWHADRCTDSSSHDSTRTHQVLSDQRSSPAVVHRHIERPSCSTQAESRARSELKRKAPDDEDVQPRKRACGSSDPW
ncbi:homeodomain-interacting protein kinase 2-like [Trachinotus anak]|uniref:homeodomain-interacting protein kinase 2-like n=1 Tax=Trachinotus anak TaxID=443729 RepID=UPI0039F1A44D